MPEIEAATNRDQHGTAGARALVAARLASGAWLGRGRIRALAALLLLVESALLLFFVTGTHGWIVPLDRPTTTDFVSFYAAGTLADAGTPERAYDKGAHRAAEERIVAPGVGYQFFNYPPVYLMLCAALAHLPYLVAFILFAAATLVFYLWVACRIVGRRDAATVLVLCAFPAAFWNLGLGQNAFLSAGLFGAATLLLDRRPVAAGLLFGALAYKPHFGLLVPLALAAAGRWRSFAAAAAMVAALVLASLAWFGWGTWQGFLVAAGESPRLYESGRILFAGFVSPFGAVRLVGGSIAWAYAVQGAASLFAASVVAAVWRCGLPLATRAASLAAATLVALPLALLYDLMLGAVAAAWLVRDDGKGRPSGFEANALLALFVALLDARDLAERWHLPVLPLAAFALLLLVCRRAWRELAQRGLQNQRFPSRDVVRYRDGNGSWGTAATEE